MNGSTRERRHALWAVAILLGGAAGAGACKARGERDAIAVIPKATYGEFWKAVHAGAARASSELGAKIVWKGPLKEDDRDGQIQMVENFANLGVRGIVLAPLDETALTPPVEAATARGIPVVVIDSDLKGGRPVSFVATDNREAGRQAALHLAKLIGGKGDVAVLRYQVGSASTANREQGFLDAIAASAPGIRVVSANQYAGPTTETAVQASENMLAARRGAAAGAGPGIDGVFCPNESSTFGMLLALRQAGLAGKIRFVGFDSSSRLIEAVDRGEIDALVLQDPVGLDHGEGVHPQPHRGLPHAREAVPGPPVAVREERAELPLDLRVERDRAVQVDPEGEDHRFTSFFSFEVSA